MSGALVTRLYYHSSLALRLFPSLHILFFRSLKVSMMDG